MEAASMEASAMESPAMEAASMEAASMEASAMESPAMEAASMEASAMESPAMEAASMEASAVEAPTMESTIMEATAMEAAPAMESPAMEATSMEAPAMEASAMESTAMKATAMASCAASVVVVVDDDDDSDELSHGIGEKRCNRALFIPFPVLGQINPMMHLARALLTATAARSCEGQDLHISFINNSFQHSRISGKLQTSAESQQQREREDLVRRRFSEELLLEPNIGSIAVDNGLPYGFDFMNAADQSSDKLRIVNDSCLAMAKSIRSFIQHRVEESEDRASGHRHRHGISFVVVGTFCDWAIDAVVGLGIPIVFFSTQSAIVLSIYFHIPRLISHGFFSEDTKYDEEHVGEDQLVTYIPGIPPLPASSFPTYMQVHDPSSPAIEFIRKQFEKARLCDAMVINTCEELEGEACRALESEVQIPVYATGPLLPQLLLPPAVPKEEEEDEHGCIAWLEQRPENSVVYISFGSIWNPSVQLIKGIAEGIRASKQAFLWALRPSKSWPSDDVRSVLPDRFLEETDGLIVPWAPQLRVLAHPSVGAFVTHCGWNSTLESISAGVPMIPIPFKTDQTTNCKLVVDVWKLGMKVRFVLESDEPLVDSDDLEKVVKRFFGEREGLELRARARQFKEKVIGATQCGGTSYDHLQKLIRFLRDSPRSKEGSSVIHRPSRREA